MSKPQVVRRGEYVITYPEQDIISLLKNADAVTIGKNIRLYREARGFTQDKLANMLDCSRQTLSNYESGKRKRALLNIELLKKIVDALNDPILLPLSLMNILAE